MLQGKYRVTRAKCNGMIRPPTVKHSRNPVSVQIRAPTGI
jgi:hypothetical protein